MLGYLILCFIGVSAGMLVAGGMFAFITMLGVVERIAAISRTAKYAKVYEDVVVTGVLMGNLIYLFQWRLPFGYPLLWLYGVFSGFFVGCLSIALAEILNVLPVLSKRIKLKFGLPYIVFVFALGKCLGVVYQFIL